MADKLEWYPWKPRAFWSDEQVRCLTPMQRGTYRELLDLDWMNDGLPEDPAHIVQQLPKHYRQNDVKILLALFFVIRNVDRRWENPHLSQLRVKARAKTNQTRAAALKRHADAERTQSGRNIDIDIEKREIRQSSSSKAIPGRSAETPATRTAGRSSPPTRGRGQAGPDAVARDVLLALMTALGIHNGGQKKILTATLPGAEKIELLQAARNRTGIEDRAAYAVASILQSAKEARHGAE